MRTQNNISFISDDEWEANNTPLIFTTDKEMTECFYEIQKGIRTHTEKPWCATTASVKSPNKELYNKMSCNLMKLAKTWTDCHFGLFWDDSLQQIDLTAILSKTDKSSSEIFKEMFKDFVVIQEGQNALTLISEDNNDEDPTSPDLEMD